MYNTNVTTINHLSLFLRCLSIMLVTATLAACGGGSSSPSNANGVFLDSAVDGLGYASGPLNGLTDPDGSFVYEAGNTIQFSIGDIVLGEVTGGPVITPIDLVPGSNAQTPQVVNIVRFLLTLDSDGDPGNGITISADVRSLAAGRTINFDQSITDFENDGSVQIIVSELTAATPAGARSLVSSSFAEDHVTTTYFGVFVGSYNGTFSGTDAGNFEAIIGADGVITATGFSAADGFFTASGQLSTNGDLLLTTGGTSTGASFNGTIDYQGNISGTWSNGPYGGDFSGMRTITGGGTGAGSGFGSVTIQGGGLPSQFVPTFGTGPSTGAADGFLQTLWQDDIVNSLALSIANNYQGVVTGTDVHLTVSGQAYVCQSGDMGSSGDCSGASYDPVGHVVTFSNVQLVGPGGSGPAVLNGSLNY